MAQIMPLCQRSAIQWRACSWCCSPLYVVFCIKNWRRATYRKKLFCCICFGVVFCSTARFFLLYVESTPCWTAFTLCSYCLQSAFLFHDNWKNNTKSLYFVVPCSCFCWTARFCSSPIKCLFVDNLVHYFATVCRLRSSNKLKQTRKKMLLLSCPMLTACTFFAVGCTLCVIRKLKKKQHCRCYCVKELLFLFNVL